MAPFSLFSNIKERNGDEYVGSEEWYGIEETVENTDRIKVILLKCYRNGYISFQMKDYIGSEEWSWYRKEVEFFFTANCRWALATGS